MFDGRMSFSPGAIVERQQNLWDRENHLDLLGRLFPYRHYDSAQNVLVCAETGEWLQTRAGAACLRGLRRQCRRDQDPETVMAERFREEISAEMANRMIVALAPDPETTALCEDIRRIRADIVEAVRIPTEAELEERRRGFRWLSTGC